MNNLDNMFDGHPAFHARHIPKQKRRTRTARRNLEAGVVKECMQWLDAQGYYCERRNTGAVKYGKAFVRYGTPGGADIFAVIHGKHVEIECKRRDGKGRLSGSQKEFRQLMKDYCIPYFVVCSVEELKQCVGAWRLHQTR